MERQARTVPRDSSFLSDFPLAMSTLSAPSPVTIQDAATPSSPARIAGFAGLTFAASVVAANTLLVGMPTADAAPADAAAWLETHRTRGMTGASMVALAFPALLIFGASMYHVGRGEEKASVWMMVGALGACAMTGVFALVAASQIGAILLASSAGDAFTTAWTIHNAAFAVNMTILGTAFLGFTIGAHSAGVTPQWLRTVGVVGAALLLMTGFANAGVAAGSPIVFFGFGGFVLWLVWVVATSLRLLRFRQIA